MSLASLLIEPRQMGSNRDVARSRPTGLSNHPSCESLDSVWAKCYRFFEPRRMLAPTVHHPLGVVAVQSRS